jgi:hypothetical protein
MPIDKLKLVYETLGDPAVQVTIHAPPGIRLLLVAIFLRDRTGYLHGASSQFWMN